MAAGYQLGKLYCSEFCGAQCDQFPIQGTAADMIKLAMIKLFEELEKRKFRSKMILQVHDELVFDALKEEAEAIKPVIIDCMQKAMPLPHDVPVIAEIGGGENWLEAH